MKLSTIALAMMLPAAALAAETPCPWTSSPTASASLTTVTVDGRTYVVRGSAEREAFSRLLNRCGLVDADARFLRWRGVRRATNVVGMASGVALIPPITPVGIAGLALITTPIAILGSVRRADLVRTLEASDSTLDDDLNRQRLLAQQLERRRRQENIKKKAGNPLFAIGGGILVASAVIGIEGHVAGIPQTRACLAQPMQCSAPSEAYTPAVVVGGSGLALAGVGAALMRQSPPGQ